MTTAEVGMVVDLGEREEVVNGVSWRGVSGVVGWGSKPKRSILWLRW